MEHGNGLPEGTPVVAKELLHLGSRAAVDQALSRLVRRGTLMRAGRGIYVRPIESRFGTRPPVASKVVEAIAAQRGESVAPHGAAAANELGLTTQVPVREVYLASGRSRRLKLGAQVVELRHVPAWQLVLPGRPAGAAIRALAWLGPKRASEALRHFSESCPHRSCEQSSAHAEGFQHGWPRRSARWQTMADFFLQLPPDERREALAVAAASSGRPMHLLDKDIWVVWVLEVLFQAPFATHLVFKGGSSLSKAY